MPSPVPGMEGVSLLPSWADAFPWGHPRCSPLCWPCSARRVLSFREGKGWEGVWWWWWWYG